MDGSTAYRKHCAGNTVRATAFVDQQNLIEGVRMQGLILMVVGLATPTEHFDRTPCCYGCQYWWRHRIPGFDHRLFFDEDSRNKSRQAGPIAF